MSKTSKECPYKAVIFDMGGVMTGAPSMNPAETINAEELTKDGPTDMALKMSVFHPDFVETFSRAEKGEITVVEMEKLFTEFARKLFKDESIEEVNMMSFSRQYATRTSDAFQNKPMTEAAKKLREKGIKIVLLSNTFFYDQKREESAVFVDASQFDEIIESCKVGHCKPEKEVYQYTLEKLGCKPEEAVFLDDFTQNLVPAKEMGIKTILVEDQEKAAKELLQLFEMKLND